jgi:hypothetical protein
MLRSRFVPSLVVLSLSACASSGMKISFPLAPEWVHAPDTCFLSGRITLDPELRPNQAEDPLAKAECRHLRVHLDTDDGSSRRIEAEGNLGGGYGECHYQFADVPPGNNTLGADFDLLPDLKGHYLFKSEVPFNAVVCGADSHSWNQSLDLVISLPEVVAPK